MRSTRLAIAAVLALGSLASGAKADSPVVLPTSGKHDSPGPTNHAVLLPPQAFDGPGKTANNVRERYGEVTVSGGALLIAPIFNTNPAFNITSGGGKLTRQVDFDHLLEVGPEIWLGYAGERGSGVRARWFQFDHDANTSHAAIAGETIRGITSFPIGQTAVTGSASANSNIAVNVWDLQWTSAKSKDRWWRLYAFGIRYMHMSQDYHATLSDAATRIDLTSGHNMNGWGPTASFELKRRIAESGFSIYGQTHGALIFGNAHESYQAVNNGVPQALTRAATDVLPVIELETGVEYQRDVGRARVFVQTAFVGQAWLGGGNASNFDATAFSSAADSNFGFLGLVLRAGVRY